MAVVSLGDDHDVVWNMRPAFRIIRKRTVKQRMALGKTNLELFQSLDPMCILYTYLFLTIYIYVYSMMYLESKIPAREVWY